MIRKQQKMRHNKRYSHLLWNLLATLVVITIVVAGCGADEENNIEEEMTAPEEDTSIPTPEIDRTLYEEDEVLATYTDGEITGGEFTDYLAFISLLNPMVSVEQQEMHEDYMHMLILDKMIAADMEDEEHEWAEEQMSLTWDVLTTQVYPEGEFEDALQSLEMSEDQVEELLFQHHVTQQHFRDQVSDDDLILADVRHILISTEEDGTEEAEPRSEEEAQHLAEELYDELQQGADFAELAEEYSEDPGSQANGGLYEGQLASAWVPEFEEAVLEQEVGEIGEPVRTDFGYHIIRVEDRGISDNEEHIQQATEQKYVEHLTETLPEEIDAMHF